MSCSCDGKCCAVFSVAKAVWEPERRAHLEDGAYIADMLIAITADEAMERARRFSSTYEPSVDDGRVWFKCRHWNEETRRCGAYDSRPRMCSEYPYGTGCDHECGYELDLFSLLKIRDRRGKSFLASTLPG